MRCTYCNSEKPPESFPLRMHAQCEQCFDLQEKRDAQGRRATAWLLATILCVIVGGVVEILWIARHS